MHNKLNIRSFLIVSWLLISSFQSISQTNNVSISTPQTLSALLNSVSSNQNIRFAFDNDLFSHIETSISFGDHTLQEFLNEICQSYGLNYKFIGGTYVFFVDNQVKFTQATKVKSGSTNSSELKDRIPTAKEYLLNGVVRNKATKEKLKNCSLQFSDGKSTQTNDMGYFSTTILTRGEIKIAINHVGFHQFDTVFTIQSSQPIEIFLQPIQIRMQSLKFLHTGNFFLEIPEVSEMIAINPKSVIHIPGAEVNDLSKGLTILPGINFLKGTNTGISIRGGNPSESVVLVDGISLIETSHLMGNFSVLNSKFITEAYVSRGGFGAEYGGSTSGIVDLVGKTGSGKVPVVDFTANILHANLYIGIPINDKTSLSGAFRKSLFDVWPNFLLKNLPFEKVELTIDDSLLEQGNVLNTTVNYYDANLKLSYRPSSRKEITFNYINSFDLQQRDNSFTSDGNYFQNSQSKYQTTGFSVNLKTQTVGNWQNSYILSMNQFNSSSLDSYGKKEDMYGLRPRNWNDSKNSSLNEMRAGWKSELKTKYITQQFGLGVMYNNLNFRDRIYEEKLPGVNVKPEDSISVNSELSQLHAYYQAKIELANWFKIRGGVRTNYDVTTGQFKYLPRYSIELFPLPIVKLSYSGGLYSQLLYRTYRVDSYQNITNIWYIPHEKAYSLNAFHHILGSRLEVNGLLVNIEAYRKENNGKSYFIAETLTANGNDQIIYKNRLGAEINRGIDLFFQYQHHFFKHLISYSYSESKEMIDGINQNQFFYSFDDQLHRLRLSEVISIGGWTASANWYYASGNPYLAKTSTSSHFELKRFSDFSQLDISLIKEFKFKYLYADMGVTFLNVLNNKNEVDMQYYDVVGELSSHTFQSLKTSTFYTPLFFINFRYE